MDQGGTLMNGLKDKKIDAGVQGLTQEKKEKEGSPTLKTA